MLLKENLCIIQNISIINLLCPYFCYETVFFGVNIAINYVNPFMNLSLGSYIMKQYGKGNFQDNIMILSSSHHGVMIGRNQNYLAECNLNALSIDNVPLIRRESGG